MFWIITIIGCLTLGQTTTADPCSDQLVTGPFGVPDSQITASSAQTDAGPDRGRLNTTATGTLLGAWMPATNNKSEYIQVELNDNSLIRGVTTQGENLATNSPASAEYVALFKVETSMDGKTWSRVTDANGKDKTFIGNTDSDTPVTNMFPCPVFGKYIRILPEAWSQKIAMRFEVEGCQINTGNTPAAAIVTAPSVTQSQSQQTTPQTNQVTTTQQTNQVTTTQGQGQQSTNQNQLSTNVAVQATTLPIVQGTTQTPQVATMALGVKGGCINSCVGRANGAFQVCDRAKAGLVCTKQIYAECSNGILYEMPCPPHLVWNDVAKYCDFTSPSCP